MVTFVVSKQCLAYNHITFNVTRYEEAQSELGEIMQDCEEQIQREDALAMGNESSLLEIHEVSGLVTMVAFSIS